MNFEGVISEHYFGRLSERLSPKFSGSNIFWKRVTMNFFVVVVGVPLLHQLRKISLIIRSNVEFELAPFPRDWDF